MDPSYGFLWISILKFEAPGGVKKWYSSRYKYSTKKFLSWFFYMPFPIFATVPNYLLVVNRHLTTPFLHSCWESQVGIILKHFRMIILIIASNHYTHAFRVIWINHFMNVFTSFELYNIINLPIPTRSI